MSVTPSKDHAGLALRLLRLAALTALAAFIIQTAFKALRSPWLTDDFPEALAVKVELLPNVFAVHMIAGGLALLLVPLALLLRKVPRWHRLAGRIAAFDVLVAGVTAFPVALIAPVTKLSAWGFTAQGVTWLVLLALGIWNIRRRNVAAHRACMLLMLAATSGAVFFRIWLALWAIWGNFRWYEAFYAFDAWFAWTFPILMTGVWLKRSGGLRFDTR